LNSLHSFKENHLFVSFLSSFSLNANDHHSSYPAINNYFFQLLQEILLQINNKEIQEQLFSLLTTKVNAVNPTNPPNHQWSSWKREFMFHLLLSADKQISYFQDKNNNGSNSSSEISSDLHSLYHLFLEWTVSMNASMVSDYELNIVIYTMAIMINKVKKECK
jgi:hypothetical protein